MIELNLDSAAIPFDWSQLFARDAPTDVEIGSGKGRFLNQLAGSQPERNFLAIERAAKYHKLCCERAAKRGLQNVRLLRTTAEDLLFRLLSPASVTTFYVLFPDPWPKKRHHKRRLFKAEVVQAMTAALVPGGTLLVKSDHPAYGEVIEEVLDQASGLQRLDPVAAFDGLPHTGFEHKYLQEGRPIRAFAFRRELSRCACR